MRVLLADDQASLRSALRLFIEDESNFEVVGEVGTTDALLESVALLHPDLVMFDWTLPTLKTIQGRSQMINTLRALLPEVYLIGLGGPHDMSSFQSSAGPNAFVSKADSPDRLRSALQQAQAASQQTPRAASPE